MCWIKTSMDRFNEIIEFESLNGKEKKALMSFSSCFPFTGKHLAKQEVHRPSRAMFLSLVLTPCLAQNAAGWQQMDSSIVFPSILLTQGVRGAAVPQTRLQCYCLQQTSSSPNPGAELFLTVTVNTVCPPQEPSSTDSPAPGS